MDSHPITMEIPAIHCDGCLKTVRRTVERLNGRYVSGDVDSKRVSLEIDVERLNVEAITEALEEIGFAATIVQPA